MSRVTIHVEVRLPTPNALMKEHFRFRAARRNREHLLVREALEKAKAQGAPFPPLPIICTFVRYSANHVDSDGLSYSCKSPRDALASFYGVDDADHLGHIAWRYEAGKLTREKVQLRTSAKYGGVRNAFRAYLRIRIEPLVERAPAGEVASCGLDVAPCHGWTRPSCPAPPTPRVRARKKTPRFGAVNTSVVKTS